MNETFPYMLPGWSAEGGQQLRDDLAPSRSGTSLGGKTATYPGKGGQPPGSVINFDPRTLMVVIYDSPPPRPKHLRARAHQYYR